MTQKYPTVTIAISAYNEEKNILPFLKSALLQKEQGFSIEKILIISDGSTDKTALRAREIKSTKVKIIEYNYRMGKSARLNEIYSSLTSDFLVQSDADVIFSNPFVIKEIIQPLINDKKVGMCGGNTIPLKAKTFTEKAVNVTCGVYSKFRQNVSGGDNIFSADGRLLAFRKRLVKKMLIPHTMIANDQFTYFVCMNLGEKYKFAKKAIVHFRSPQTLKDQIKQNTRFLASPIRLAKYFPAELIHKETHIPINVWIRAYFSGFRKHPVLSSYIFIVNTYCRVKASIDEKKLDAKWPIANSTKALR